MVQAERGRVAHGAPRVGLGVQGVLAERAWRAKVAEGSRVPRRCYGAANRQDVLKAAKWELEAQCALARALAFSRQGR